MGREHCLKLLTSALRSNSSVDTIESSSSEIQELASNIEFHVFLKSKLVTTYKTNCFQMVQKVNQASKLGKVFVFDDKQVEESTTEKLESGFMKASEYACKQNEKSD